MNRQDSEVKAKSAQTKFMVAPDLTYTESLELWHFENGFVRGEHARYVLLNLIQRLRSDADQVMT
jgi:hypothetical protein